MIETPRALQPLDQREEMMLLLGRQRRGRLVEDDDLGIVVHGPGDLDHLLLPGSESGDESRRVDMEVQRLQELLAGDVDAAKPVEAPGVGQIDVLGDRQRRDQARLLIDHRDAAPQRLGRRPQFRLLPIDPDFARSRLNHAGQHLGKRGFSRAIFAEQSMHLAAVAARRSRP